MSAVFRTDLSGLPRLKEGKARDLYEINADQLLMVTTDRLSAFDVILPTPIPDKGRILIELSDFWFDRLQSIVPHHRLPLDLQSLPLSEKESTLLTGRSMRVRRLNPLPIEAIVRGYLIGSGWRDYQQTGTVCGLRLPEGLKIAEALPEPLFTPSTKGEPDEHDENITFDEVVARIGEDLAEQVQQVSLALYDAACQYAAERGVIIADTKFEFGLDAENQLVWIDEALTPDSSRFWDADQWQPGTNPHSYDKQFVRDWLESQPWDKRPPAPELPDGLVTQTQERYQQIKHRLME